MLKPCECAFLRLLALPGGKIEYDFPSSQGRKVVKTPKPMLKQTHVVRFFCPAPWQPYQDRPSQRQSPMNSRACCSWMRFVLANSKHFNQTALQEPHLAILQVLFLEHCTQVAFCFLQGLFDLSFTRFCCAKTSKCSTYQFVFISQWTHLPATKRFTYTPWN